ncbi:hypothetical protein FHQ18_11575 [Deferribacter autotrophicus]|uniref:Uncharacterized protein n=1 Tax=Deferribacter autotrophicus TaxID=500465 RepID=A0A5A8F5R2_9BACT|nr:hypothetical protein [Deferribacter autotrophicus]KAA0257197.1 hypothetical protein FHQ18_11575 [Deferribacter autotrophicus]
MSCILNELSFDERLVRIMKEVGKKDETLANIIIQELIVNPVLGEKLYEMFKRGESKEQIIAEKDNYLSRFYNKKSYNSYKLHATF